jgi:hypothetical protein
MRCPRGEPRGRTAVSSCGRGLSLVAQEPQATANRRRSREGAARIRGRTRERWTRIFGIRHAVAIEVGTGTANDNEGVVQIIGRISEASTIYLRRVVKSAIRAAPRPPQR